MLIKINVNPNNLNSAMCDMQDIKDRTKRLLNHSKDEDNSMFTVKDCVDDVIYFLEGLEGQVEEQYLDYQDDHGG